MHHVDEGGGGASGLGSLIRSLGGGRQAASIAGGAQAVLRATSEAGGATVGAAPERNLPPALAGTGTLFITFGNSAFVDFIDNWALSVQRLGLPYVIGALDRSLGQHCKAAGHPHIHLWREEVRRRRLLGAAVRGSHPCSARSVQRAASGRCWGSTCARSLLCPDALLAFHAAWHAWALQAGRGPPLLNLCRTCS